MVRVLDQVNDSGDVWQFRSTGSGGNMGRAVIERNGGDFSGVAVGWLNWQLKGDARARHLFVGTDCGLCVNPHWVVRSKNLH